MKRCGMACKCKRWCAWRWWVGVLSVLLIAMVLLAALTGCTARNNVSAPSTEARGGTVTETIRVQIGSERGKLEADQ